MDAAGPAPPPPAPRHATAGGLVGAMERLWCLTGHHAPDETMVWHGGYGFAHCRRCGEEIVRSLLSGWTVPGPDLRIVWDTASSRPAAPAGLPQPVVEAVAPSAKPAAPAEPQAGRNDAASPSGSGLVVAEIAPRPRPRSLPMVLEPLDLLGPHFMGEKGAPPGPSEGLSVFEFDDMAADDGAEPDFGVAMRGGR